MPELPMPLLLAALGLVLILALLISLFRTVEKPPYQTRQEFLSPAELKFFRALEQAVGQEAYIFPKVRIGDLLQVIEGTENSQSWFARIGQKHADFILADRRDVKPLLVIELDDSTHQRADRQERDQFVDSAMKAAGLPIIHIPLRTDYPPEELAPLLRPHLAARR